jgi:hypothetical protein
MDRSRSVGVVQVASQDHEQLSTGGPKKIVIAEADYADLRIASVARATC